MRDDHDGRLLRPGELDVTTPSPARMYDVYLGGKDNYEADRAAVEQITKLIPELPAGARANRACLIRAVTFLARELGFRQFVDIGSGLPTQQNVHQVAQDIDPSCRVVYVDNDPSVLTHSRVLLAHADNTTFVRHDLRQPDAILADPKLRALIDFGRPVALMLVAVLHFLTDDDKPYEIVAQLRDAIPSGSTLTITHATPANLDRASQSAPVYQRATTRGGAFRTREQVLPFFEGMELIEPGLVAPHEWHPELGPAPDDELRTGGAWGLAGMARKP